MDDLIKLIFASSFFILYYSMCGSYFRNTLNLTDPMLTLAYGILIGHHGLSLLKTHYVYSKIIVLNFSKLVLCLQTMTIALKIPKGYIKRNLNVLSHLILTIGILKCILTFILIRYSTYFNASTAWALSAALTPTDPILSASIVKGDFSKKNVPEKLKLLLNAESGINDGIGILLLYVSLDIMRHSKEVILKEVSNEISKEISLKTLIINYIIYTILIKLVVSALIGGALGAITRKLARISYKRQLINSDILLVHTFALTALCLSLMTFIDGSELICIFFCGIYLNEDEWYTNTKISDVIENAFTNSLFVFLGSRIDFGRMSKKIIILSLIILMIRPILVFLFRKILVVENDNNNMLNINMLNINMLNNVSNNMSNNVSMTRNHTVNNHTLNNMNNHTLNNNTLHSHSNSHFKKREALFVGWFGPVGVGALYYSLLYDCKVEALTVDYAMCAVFLSVFIHGFSVPVYILIKRIINKL